MAELCGSLPRRHGRRRSRRSRSRHAKRSRSANMASARQDVDVAEEVAKLRAEYDAVVTSSDARNPSDAVADPIVTSQTARCPASASEVRNTDLNSNVVAAPEIDGGRKSVEAVGSASSGAVEVDPQANSDRKDAVYNRRKRGNRNVEMFRKDAAIPGDACFGDSGKGFETTPEYSCENRSTHKTDMINLGETNKTESLIPKSTNLVKQVEAFKTSVIEKCEPLVNGMSFKNALESRKSSNVEVDERKPPVIYSRKNSLLNDDASSRNISTPKVDADWRQSSLGDKMHWKNDIPMDRKFSQSKEKYFVRRNSLPREEFSSRRNSSAQDETYSRRNSFSKNDFSSRRNSFTKADQDRRNSMGKEKLFARKNSFSKEEPSPPNNSSSLNEPYTKGNKESNSRRGSLSENLQQSRRNSFSRNEGPPKNDEFSGKQRIIYASKPFKKDSPFSSSRKKSFPNAGPYARKNSWSQSDYPLRNKELEPQIQHEHQFRDYGAEKKSKYELRSTDYHGIRDSCSTDENLLQKIDGKEIVPTIENDHSGSNVSGQENLNSKIKGLVPENAFQPLHSSHTPSNLNVNVASMNNAIYKIPSENTELSILSCVKSNASNDASCRTLNTNPTEPSGISGCRSRPDTVNLVECGVRPGITSSYPTKFVQEFPHSAGIITKSGSLPGKGHLSNQIGNAAPDIFDPVSSNVVQSILDLRTIAPGHDPVLQKPEVNGKIPWGGELSNQISASSPENAPLQSNKNQPGSAFEYQGGVTELSQTCNAVEEKSSLNIPAVRGGEGDADTKFCASINMSNGLTNCGHSAEIPCDVIPAGNLVSPSLVEVCENICKEFSSSINSADTNLKSTSDSHRRGSSGQWSPTNPVGKKKYPKDFLYSLADTPQCRIPPSLPMSVRVFVEKVSGGGSGGGPSMYRPKIDELYPFSKGSSQSPRISHNSAYSFPSITKRSSQSGRMNKPNKIQLSLSLHEDVKLKESDNAWKPGKLAKKGGVDMNTEEKKTEELYNKVRSILNKLTPQKLDTLVSQIKDLPINNPERLGGVVDLIIKKAIDEPNFSEAYAKMCKILSTGHFMNINADPEKGADKNQTDFRRVLLNCCQKQFELREKIETDYKEKIKNDLKEVTDPEKLKELKFQHQEEERKIRMKAAGHCRFIGELFKLDMLRTNIMHNCILYLLKKTDEEPLESLCKLLTTIGKHYENRLEGKNQSLDPIMEELSKLASKNKKKKNAPQISSRIRFMIQDVLDLKANNWVPRRDDNTPKTIDQIHKEAEREQLETNIALANTSMKKLDRPRMDDRDRKRGGRMDGLMNSDADSWQTPKNVSRSNSSYKGASYSVDLSKFENFKAGLDLSDIRLGPGPKANMWSTGAVTNKGPGQPDQSRSKVPERNQFAALDSLERDINQFPFNSSNKSMSITRDKSRDSRNLSQDDDMLPKRGPPVGGPPSREGSHMRSAPPSIQPPAPAVKPVLEPEAMVKIVKSTLDEYISVKQISEVEHTLKTKFVTPACLEKFVDAFIEYFLEKRKDQEIIAPVLGLLLDSKNSNFTPQILVDRFNDFLSMAEDLIIDYPKLWDYMAMIMGYTLSSEHFNFDHVRQSCKSILKSDNSKKVLALVFNVISSIKTAVWISHKWNSSKVTLNDFIADNDIDEFIKTNKLEYLSDPNAPILKSSTPTFTFEEIKKKLLQILQEHPDDALVPVQSWVNENWGPGPYDHTLIRPLMTAICEASITGAGEKNNFNKEVLEKHSKLISYYVDYNPNLEAHCLMAICILMEKLQHPKGLALNFFQHLLEHTMSLDGFKRFHCENGMEPPSNSEENRIRGIVVLGTRSFWTAAFENLENSDDEGTS